MKFVLDQTFCPTFSCSPNQIFKLDTFEFSFIQHLVFYQCADSKLYAVERVSNVFIDIWMSIICGVLQKVKRWKGHKQDKREEAKATIKKEKNPNPKKDWTNDEISLLIYMLQANLCLWNVYHTDYTKRGMKDIAYKEITILLDTNIPLTKTKVNSLKAHLVQTDAQKKSTKSGQSTAELYWRNWIHYDKLAFLFPVIGASKSRDTLKKNTFVRRS